MLYQSWKILQYKGNFFDWYILLPFYVIDYFKLL